MTDDLVKRAAQVIRGNNKATVLLSQAEAVAILARIDALTVERDALKAEQIDAIRAALEAAAAIAEDAESGRCQRCGHPRNNHPYRHPFIGFASGDLPAAIRALDPAAIMAGQAEERVIQ